MIEVENKKKLSIPNVIEVDSGSKFQFPTAVENRLPDV